MKYRNLIVGFVASLLPAFAFAGSLSVGPTRVELSDKNKVQVITVRNTGVETTIVQMDTMTWARDDAGADFTDVTTQLIATPAVFELKPGQQRQVRVGLREGELLKQEQSYRLYLREVRPTATSIQASLQFALRIGIPVYVGGISSPMKPGQRSISQ
ncbi:MAG: fimbria/pilus periplasmic chaperone [Steroidobacteraceae bacterium]